MPFKWVQFVSIFMFLSDFYISPGWPQDRGGAGVLYKNYPGAYIFHCVVVVVVILFSPLAYLVSGVYL